jgi:hypothetical protein
MTPEEEIRSIFREEIKDLKSDVKQIREEMTTLKVKVALFSSIIGSLAAIAAEKLF